MTELPDGWQADNIGTIADTQLGKMLNSSKQTGTAAMPYLRNINLRWGGFDLSDVKEMDIFHDEREQFTLRTGDLLICEGGEPGRCAVWKSDLPMAFQNAMHRVRPKATVSADFLALQVESQVRNGELDHLFSGVTIKHFSQQKLRGVEVLIPPLAEQQRIVEILEEQFSRLDAALASIRTVRENAAAFRRSLLQAAFHGALAGDSAVSIPSDWSLLSLDEVSEVRLGRQRSPRNHSGPQLRPYLRAANVTWQGLDLTDVKEMNFSDEELSVLCLKSGDILVGEASGSPNEVGKAAVFQGEIENCCFQNTLLRVRPLSIDTRYLHYFLTGTAMSGAYARESRGVGISHLGRAKLASWPVPVAPAPEQQRIGEMLDEQFSRLDAALVVTNQLEARIVSERRSLLHAAFSGALTEQWRTTHNG